MNIDSNCFMDEIFDIESRGMFSDISMSSELLFDFMGFNETQINHALSYIKSVLKECYDGGHLRVAISHNEHELHGYAMMFVHPDKSYANYLHKIYVHDKYRGNKVGDGILKSLLESSPNTTLLCSPDKIKFYEKYGFSLIQKFSMPESDEFILSKELYSDLYLMSNNEETLEAPIFFLNDIDLKNMAHVPEKI